MPKAYTVHSPRGSRVFRAGTNPMYVERAILQETWECAPDSKLAHDVAVMEIATRPLEDVSVALPNGQVYVEAS